MIRIAICDDEGAQSAYTAALVRKELPSYELEIERFPTADALLREIESDAYSPDIAVLDIMLGADNGIELAKKLNLILPGCRIIFLTGYADFAPESYEAVHVWFVTKAAAECYLGAALRRAMDGLPGPTEELGITARRGGKHFFVPLGEVLYLDRHGRKARIVCKEGAFEVSGQPSALISGKTAPFFLHCHQGYWVNLKQIRGLDRNEFVLNDGTRVPISRSRREESRRRFFENLLG